MRKTISVLGGAFALALLANVAMAHGGTFTGPGGGGTPGFGGGIGGGTGEPGPNGPGGPGGGGTTGGGGGGTTGGPGAPSAPVRPGGGLAPGGGSRGFGGVTPNMGKKSKNTPRFMDWDWWWDLNEERFLNLKSKIRKKEADSDNADTFLGDIGGSDDVAEVTLRQIRNKILPSLKVAMKDSFYDTRAAAVIAIGKVGDKTQPALVDDIVSLMKDENRRVRESCCLGLGILGNKDAIPALLDIANNTSKGKRMLGRGTSDVLNRTRMFAAVGIGLIGVSEGLEDNEDAISSLIKMATTKSKQQDLQVGPAIALQLINTTRTIPQLIQIFEDPEQNRFVRAHVGIALGKLGAKAAVPNLIKGLENKETFIARSSAISLGLLTEKDDTKTVNKIIRFAESASDRGVRNFCLIALGEIGNARGRAHLMKEVKKGKNHDQAFASIAVGIAGFKHKEDSNAMGRLLLQTFKDTRADPQRGAMAIGLGLLGFEPAKDVMRKTLSSPGSLGLKGNICTALGLMGDKDSIPAIQKLVAQRGDPDLRKRAAIALGLLRDTEAVGILEKVISESSASKAILGAATVALGFIGDKKAVDMLVDFVENSKKQHQDVSRAFAAVALGFLGDKAAIPLLSKIHENSNYLAQTGGLAELLTIL